MPPSEIRIASGVGVGQRYPIGAKGRVIGRAPTADVRVRDAGVSDHHAMVVMKDGRDFIYDLGSDTGTYVNEARVEQAELRAGDVIRVGQIHIEYLSPHANVVAPRVSVVDPMPPPSVSPMPQQSGMPPVGGGALVPVNPMAVHAQLLLSQMAFMQQQQQMNAGLGRVMPTASLGPPAMEGEGDGAAGPSIVDRLKIVYEFYKPYLKFIAASAILGIGVGLSSLAWKPPSRKASFEVNLISTMADNPVKQFERGLVEFFRAAHISFKSPALIEKTLNALGEVDVTPGRIGGIQGALSLEGISKLGNTITYQGKFGGGPGEWPLRFLGAHLRLFLESEIDKTLKMIRVEVDFLEKQLAENEKELRRTEREVLEFKKRNIDGLPDQARQYYDLLFDLERQRSTAETEVTRIKSLQRVDRVRLSAEAPLTESRVTNARPYQQQIFDVQSRLAAARASNQGEDHPEVQRLNAQLVELRRLAREAEEQGSSTDVERRRNPTYTAIQDSLRSLDAAEETARAETGRLRRELERVKGVVDRLPELDAQYASLQRSYETSRDLHNRIFAQLKATRLQYDLEKASARARYDIITPPGLEVLNPVTTGGLRGGVGLVAGLVLSVALSTLLKVRQLRRAKLAAAQPAASTALVEISTDRWPYRSQ